MEVMIMHIDEFLCNKGRPKENKHDRAARKGRHFNKIRP